MNRYHVELDNGVILIVHAYSAEQVKDMLLTYEVLEISVLAD